MKNKQVHYQSLMTGYGHNYHRENDLLYLVCRGGGAEGCRVPNHLPLCPAGDGKAGFGESCQFIRIHRVPPPRIARLSLLHRLGCLYNLSLSPSLLLPLSQASYGFPSIPTDSSALKTVSTHSANVMSIDLLEMYFQNNCRCYQTCLFSSAKAFCPFFMISMNIA